jgi:hypothetical protein
MKTIKDIRENLKNTLEVVEQLEQQQESKKEWSPDGLEYGDEYWRLDGLGDVVSENFENHPADRLNILTGNCFLTPGDALYHYEMLRLAKSIRDQAFEPDWSDVSQNKWVVAYNHEEKKILCLPKSRMNGRRSYFETIVKAKTAFKDVSHNDFLYMLRNGMI